MFRRFEPGEALAGEGNQLRLGRRRALFQLDKGAGHLAPFLIRLGDDGAERNRRVMHQRALDLDRADVFAAGDDDILRAVGNLHIGIGVLDGDVPSVEIAPSEGLRRCAWVLVIAFHDRIAAHHDLPQGRAIHRNLRHGLRRHYRHMVHIGEGHTLARFDPGALFGRQIIPEPILPGAFSGRAIDLGQAVNLGYVEAHGFNGGERCGGGRCTGGEDLDGMVKGPALFVFGVDDHVQDNRCAAKMGHALIGNGVIDVFRSDLAAADGRAAKRGHAPDMAPIVAMEERDDGQIARVKRHPPRDRRAHGDQISAAVVIDHAFGPACGAGGIVERNRLPFILGHDPGRIRVALGQERVIGQMAARGVIARLLIRHFDDQWRFAFHRADGGLQHGQELGVGQHDFRLAMVEDIADRAGVETDIDAVEHGTGCGHAKMRLHMGRDVGQEGRHHIARRDAAFCQRRGKARDAGVVFNISGAETAIDQRGARWKDGRRAGEMGKRRQRHVIRRTLLKARFVFHPAHASPPFRHSFTRVCGGAGGLKRG